MTATTTKPARQSRAARAAAKAKADPKPSDESIAVNLEGEPEQPAADAQPEQPATGEQPETTTGETETQPESDAKPTEQPAESEQPAKAKEMTASAKRQLVMSALVKAAADLAESWEHPEITAEEARAALAHRMSYSGPVEWDDRLGPAPLGRGKFPEPK
jgi:hypothetical protein